MIHHLITDIPPELSVVQVGSELARRIDETLEKYSTPSLLGNDRVNEDDTTIMYVTPYDHLTMPFMSKWNDILIDAIKVPASIKKEYGGARLRIDANDKFVQTAW